MGWLPYPLSLLPVVESGGEAGAFLLMQRHKRAWFLPEALDEVGIGHEASPELAIRVGVVPLLDHVVEAGEIADATFHYLAARIDGPAPVELHVGRRMCLAEVDKPAAAVVISPDIPDNNAQTVELLDVSAHPWQHFVR